jgi:hypothetical protein
MALHLLTLPGEIRNRIFEFALTESEGVNYREDERGVGWLCLYERDHGDDGYEWEDDGDWEEVDEQPGMAAEATTHEKGNVYLKG